MRTIQVFFGNDSKKILALFVSHFAIKFLKYLIENALNGERQEQNKES